MILHKDLFKRSASPDNGSWAFLNDQDNSSCSQNFYALAVPDNIHAKLDDFSENEEREFWQLTFDISSQALDSLNRSGQRIREILIGVNDGVYAGQTVPHTHSHIVGLHDIAVQPLNFKAELESLRNIFCPQMTAPDQTRTIRCNLSDINEFTTRMRKARQEISGTDDRSFRIYTDTALRTGIESVKVSVEACTPDSPQFSVAGAMRVLNGITTSGTENLLNRAFELGSFTHFEPLITP